MTKRRNLRAKGLTKQYSHRYRADASPGQGSRDDDDEKARARRGRGEGNHISSQMTGTKGNSSVDQPGCSTAVRTTSEEKRLPTTSQDGEPVVSNRAEGNCPYPPHQLKKIHRGVQASRRDTTWREVTSRWLATHHYANNGSKK